MLPTFKIITLALILAILALSVVFASIPIPFYSAILQPSNIHQRIYNTLPQNPSISGGRSNSCLYDGIFLMFAVVDHSTGKSFQKVEHFNYEQLQVIHDGTYFHIKVMNPSQQNETLYELKPLKDGQYQIYGNMRANSPNLFFSDKVDNSLQAHYNFTIDRIYGYYGQRDFEMPDERFRGIIMWNTYSHNSQVKGVLNYGSKDVTNTIVQANHEKRFRFYCDMNFGEYLPTAPDNDIGDKKYAWGWYYVNIPSENYENELSIIAGTGRTFAGFPLFTMDARFADIRLNSTHHIELTELIMYDETFYYTNDGKVHAFSVDRSDWTSLSDNFGTADIPLTQLCTMETDNYLILRHWVFPHNSKWFTSPPIKFLSTQLFHPPLVWSLDMV
ncbi:hypothetical protein C9374_010261 [Naegleria lovaniensis]|uniref:Uncharacterized protein n=1 Tax=Naegleria lovaniensis TaxID=51637 RepID=A0AA88KJG5_NAELO|nr:uncharacterized protein C9374_010261 [Naegleria lovaniensis]KAG2374887.1 hypothetical protein C9374_010261 [Naegleria lovaniensis]